jgi:hypothetical protein
MFEDFSIPYEFNAEWLCLYKGRKVRLHFNPREPKCVAKIVLLEACGERKAGEILGDAALIGETTQHVRLVMGWAEDNQRAGYIARQRAANFVRRETRAVTGAGRATYSATEIRDGIAGVTKVEIFNPRGGDGPSPEPGRDGPVSAEASPGKPLGRPSDQAGADRRAVLFDADETPPRGVPTAPEPLSENNSLTERERRAAEWERQNALDFL